jgi:hypothetical protein
MVLVGRRVGRVVWLEEWVWVGVDYTSVQRSSIGSSYTGKRLSRGSEKERRQVGL